MREQLKKKAILAGLAVGALSVWAVCTVSILCIIIPIVAGTVAAVYSAVIMVKRGKLWRC